MATSVLPRMKLHASNVEHVREGMAMVRKVFGVGSGNTPGASYFLNL